MVDSTPARTPTPLPSSGDEERAHLVRRMTSHGMSVEDATAAIDADRVMVALLEHLLEGPPVLTAADIAEATGLAPNLIDELDRVSGRTPGGRYPERSLRQFELLGRLGEMVPEDALIEQLRGDLPALRAMAMRSLGTIEQLLIRPVLETTDDPVDAAVQIAQVGRPLLDVVTPLLGESYRWILMQIITSDLVVHALRAEDEAIEAAVAFIDVVGFTSITGRLDPTGLADVLSRFEDECSRLVEDVPEVTLVKFLGDAAMFVCLDPLVLADALLTVISRMSAEEDPEQEIPASAGLAFGETLVRRGDYFGTAVNEAARLTDLARRHTVVASAELKEVLDGPFTMRRLPSQHLAGLGKTRPYAVRRAEADAS